jgi:UDP-glucuronate 4-epimerase
MSNGSDRSAGPVLVTGAAGFIGFHVAQRLLQMGRSVVGVDSINDYYDPSLKDARLAILRNHGNFEFAKVDISDRRRTAAVFAAGQFPLVIHLAAQAGVRYSIDHPHAYASANLEGFVNVLEGCRHGGCHHLLFASSSSVYGANSKVPFSVHDNVDHPISLYAATKKANELMAHAYSHLYRLPATGMRFFTVYGPWGRPDMAMFIFARAIMAGRPIKLFNQGRMRRDFTFIDDAAEAVIRLADRPPAPQPSASQGDPAVSAAPWRIHNIGNHRPEELTRVVELLEAELGRKAIVELAPMQPGDVPETFADTEDLAEEIGFRPAIPIEEGVRRFAAWYRDYHEARHRTSAEDG